MTRHEDALDEAQRLQSADDVLGLDGGHSANVLDGKVTLVLLEDAKQDLGPVAAERQQAEIGQRLLGGADLVLALRELVR